ncbi:MULTISPECIES: glycosyltransferase [unclassified Mesorhizobium]|uniref:glycosyltransferase n=1 Tax=unclassified Mesorhizobium TaxID=325217 RepID=UPI002415068B|nr:MULTISPECIES: glycosyltransferase [unclassified Mesorhizobium]MDG4854511.1 glycosyltransferase [Mesorhizobium sp. WSM4982]MDG4916008.1 glycosyltransferase [Mesorhizobium sp. WSM4983]
MKIGLFLAYRPNTPFSNQGLGRLMAELLRGFSQTCGEPVTVVCPSWLASDVQKLTSRLPEGSVHIVSPARIPVIVRIHQALFRQRTQPRKGLLGQLLHRSMKAVSSGAGTAFRAVMATLSTRSVLIFFVGVLSLAIVAAAATIALAPVFLIGLLVVAVLYGIPRLERQVKMFRKLASVRRGAVNFASRALGDRPSLLVAIYNTVHRKEVSNMLSIIDRLSDIDIWYSPTIFWPEFNQIKKPTVQCYPDMVLGEFPTRFAFGSRTDRLDAVFGQALSAIQSGKYFITYSSTTAGPSLHDRFGVPRDSIITIPHAAMDLSGNVLIHGTPDAKAATDKFARVKLTEFQRARWNDDRYLHDFDFTDCQYLFYASQFRPNKNILNLLKAYEIVLRRKFYQCKLILTGHLDYAPEVRKFLEERRLGYDVILAQDVSDQMLAALYRGAALAVNPTLYEGGFPFTFTEAMSVGTPVIMSRIPQTEEFIKEELADQMLFDPLSPEEIAEKIVFGLNHRSELYDLQFPLYELLRERTWRDVAMEHVVAFEKILADHNSRPRRTME